MKLGKSRRTAGVQRRPQVLPVLQDEALVDPLNDNPLPPFNLEAKVETFLRTCELPQAGQVISLAVLEERTSSSNWSLHSWHSNS
jgi:hypothetical protein